MSGRAVIVQIKEDPGASLAILPMTGERRGSTFGVVEVVSDNRTITERMDAVRALVDRTAKVLNAPAEGEGSEDGHEAALQVSSELLWARTPKEAVATAVRGCFHHLETPIVGLLPDRDGWGWFLAASEGLGSRTKSQLRQRVRRVDGEPSSHRLDEGSLRRGFRDVSGYVDVTVIGAEDAIILIGGSSSSAAAFLESVGRLLGEVLRKFELDRLRHPSDSAHALGIAWTAHELRGPLLGAHAALDRAAIGTLTETRDLVRRTRDELERVSSLIEPLLRWTTGGESLSRQPADLTQVAREAIESSCFGLHGARDRISFHGAEETVVVGDREQLRSAIANVVRNALVYSPDGSRVNVRVQTLNGSARVVVRDRGPGVSPDQLGALFDPFVRGRDNRSQQGTGLGLFIARRVLEAHGGSISVRPTSSGATFVLELPTERRESFAS